MSQETGQEAQQEQSQTADAQVESDRDWQAEAEKWEALSRKHEERAKAGFAAEKRLREIEDAGKSAEQRYQEALSAAEERAAQAERALTRSRVAAKHDLGDLAEFLTGDTDEELEEQAKRLAKRLKATPPPSYDGGARTTAQAPADMNQLIRQAAGRA